MLKKIDNSTVESTSGYVVKFLDRFKLEYIEGDHRIKFFVENDHGPAYQDFQTIIFLSPHIRWEPPHEREPIPPEKKRQIQKNVEEALSFLGERCRFEPMNSMDT